MLIESGKFRFLFGLLTLSTLPAAIGCMGDLGGSSSDGPSSQEVGGGPACGACGGQPGTGGGPGGIGGTGAGTGGGQGGEAGSGPGGSGGAAPAPDGFGFPVGDGLTAPAGGWQVWQVLGHYWAPYGGRHLAQDVSLPGGVDAIDAPVLSVADGTVLYAKPNASSYVNVVLIEHPMSDGTKVCSFYGHVTTPLVEAGQQVSRGQPIASVLNWADAVQGGAPGNTHLHYVLLSGELCEHAAASGTGPGTGSGVCGYDGGGPSEVGHSDLANEPYYYTAELDACGADPFVDGFISPSKFIADHLAEAR